MFEAISISILPLIILTILSAGMLKKVPLYEEFTSGAKDGFVIAVKIIPYLVALIVAVSMFRASGAMDWLGLLLSGIFDKLSVPVDVLPVMITRSLSGSATLGVLSEIVSSNGANSYTAFLAAVMVGSSETTFYVLSVYFGSIGIKKFRYAVLTGIIADITGILLSISICRHFFPASIM